MIKFRNKGFTLIELIVAIGILGILAVAAIMALDPVAQLQKSNDVRRKSDLAQIQRALESYYQDNNKYPPSTLATTTPPYEISGTAWGNSWQPYMNILPQDPASAKHYVYYSTVDRQSYYIYASLDRGSKDTAACTGDLCTSPSRDNLKLETACGGSGKCDFGVSSPDVSP